MGSRVDRAAEIVADLTAAGIVATWQASEVAGLAPCVVVAPPVLDYTGATFAGPVVTWNLHAVASTSDPAGAWEELDELLAQVAEALPLTRADPSAYALGDAPRPAYTMTYAETLED